MKEYYVMQKKSFYVLCILTLCTNCFIHFGNTEAFAQDKSTPSGSSVLGNVGPVSAYKNRSDVRLAIRQFDQSREQLINEARIHFNNNEFDKAISAYQRAEDLTLDLPAPPDGVIQNNLDGPIQKNKIPLALEYGEWGEALAAVGKVDAAIGAYRNIIYTQRSLKGLRPSDELSPLTVLPEGATNLEEARERFPQAVVKVWLSNTPSVLARYAQLLVIAEHHEEAILVYRRALKNMAGETYEPLLELGNLSAENFDKKRFLAGLHVIFALDGSAEIWYGYYKHEDMKDVREAELNKAIKVKPDYTPALLAYVDVIVAEGKTAPIAKQRLAKQYLEKAELYARSEAQRDLARQRYTRNASRLAN